MKRRKKAKAKTHPRRPLPTGSRGGGRDRAVDLIIGANVRRFRTERGMSQTALGRALGGITFQQVQKYEKGSNSLAACRIPQMCRALTIDLPTLFAGAIG